MSTTPTPHQRQCICLACERRRQRSKAPRKQMPDVPACAPGEDVTLATLELYHIKLVLEKSPNLNTAAKILGIDLATLYRKRRRASQDC
jgi:transcriptional regulator with PAS, ATPase and Fis domain